MRIVVVASIAAGLGAFLVGRPGGRCGERAATSQATTIEPAAPLQRLPIAFVPNVGQWDEGVRYVARAGATTMYLEDAG